MSKLADCEYALEEFARKIQEIAVEAYNDGDIDGLKEIIELCNKQLGETES
jgi:hypothetical protein